MRELELAGIPTIAATRPRRGGRARFRLSRAAFAASLAAHLVAGYSLLRHTGTDSAPRERPTAEFFLFEMPVRRAADSAAPATPPADPPPRVAERQIEPPRAAETDPRPSAEIVLPPRAADTVREPRVVEPAPGGESLPADEAVPAPFVDFAAERERAARDVVTQRAAENEYLTFSLDDVAPPRPEETTEPKRSIFDGAGEPIGPKVGQLGQARTKFGHRLAGLCNALTGGFSLMGFGSFCAPPPDGSPSGLFPEVRPAYLDLMPECVDTRDTAPALALEASFPTVKCRLVEQRELADQP